MTVKETVTETWVYEGRRWDRGDKKITYQWKDADGKSYLYAKAKAVVVGGHYTIDVARREGSTSIYPNSLVFLDDTVSDDERAVLIAADRGAYRRQQKVAAEKRYANSDPLAEAMVHLERIAAQVKTYNELETFLYVVKERLITAWDKKSA